jgi:hypothetical protein
MNYTIRKLVYYILIFSGSFCGFVFLNLADKGGNNSMVYGEIFIVCAFIAYVMGFYIHDPNDGADY